MSKTHTSKGRTVALLAATGVVAVAAVAAARWEELATRYYRYRLESDESYLGKLIDSPRPNSAQEKALREYCETEQGGATLCRWRVGELSPAQEEALRAYLRTGRGGAVAWEDSDSVLIQVLWEAAPAGRSRTVQSRVHRLLNLVDGGQFTLERYPGLTFELEWPGLPPAFVYGVAVASEPVPPRDHDPPP